MSKEGINWSNTLLKRASVQIGRSMSSILLNKRVIITYLVMLFPFYIALYTVFDSPEGIENWPEVFSALLGWVLYMQVLLLIFSLIYGSSLINSEIESRTITYLFMRGSKRFEVIIYKFIGVHLSLSILLTNSVFLTYFAFSLHTSDTVMIDNLIIPVLLSASLILGSFVYLALFSLLGVIFKHPLVIGLIYAFLWEVFMTNIPLNVQKATLMYYVRSILLGSDMVRDLLDYEGRSNSVSSMFILILLGILFLVMASFFLSRKDIH